MADKRISQLVERTTLANNDVLPIVASGASTTNKVTLQTIEDWMQGNLNFGVTSVAISVPTGLTVTGSPITSTGTFIIGFAAGYSIPTNTKQSEWDAAYNDKINSVAVTGTTTKTITLTQQDGGTLSAQWSDLQPVTSVFGRTGDVVAVEGDYSLDQLSGVGITSPSSGQVLKYDGTNWVNATEQYVGTVTSVGVSVPAAFSVTGSPITTSGTITISGAGTSAQYIDGTGSLQTFPNLIAQATNLVREVYNNSGATMTKGTVVYINGGHGNLPTIAKAKADADSTSAQTYGVVQANISDQSNGYIVVVGDLTNIDTQGYLDGTQLYLSGTTAGNYTSTKPYAPIHIVYVGIVTRSHPTQGIIAIKIQNGYEMDEIHDVDAQNPSDNDILQYKTATGLWTKTAGTTTNIAEGTNLYYTNERARQSISETITGIDYDNTTGVFSTTSGYGIPTTAKQTQWDAAYNDKINSASVSGTTTKTLTLTQQDGGTITTSWSDYDTAPVTSVFGRTGAIVATEGDYNLTQLGDVTITTPSNGQVLKYNGTTWVNDTGYVGTVTSVGLSVPTGLSVSGSPITTSGTLAISLQSGYSIPTTASQTNWDAAYNDKINSAAVTGTTTKTLTLTQQDGGTITASWTDINTDAVTSVFGRTGAVVATEGDYTLTQLGDVTITTPTNGQFLKYDGTSWINAAAGTVTSVALATGTTGTDVGVTGSPITGAGTITLNIPVASATNTGKLSSTDWSTFNGKEPAIAAGTTAQYWRGDKTWQNFNTAARGSISLTTTGTSGAATYDSATGVLNVPQYSTDLSGYVTIATDQTITGVKIFRNTGSDTLVIRGVDAAGTQGQGAAVYLGGNDGTLDRNYAAIYARKENGTSGNPAGELVFGVRDVTLGVRDALTISSNRNVSIAGSVTASSIIKTGGTASQFLKANGSVDSNTYLTAETDTLQSVILRNGLTNTGFTIENGNSTYSTPASTNVPLIYIHNTSTNANGHAILSLRSMGPNGGDPFVSLDIDGVIGWHVGVDNSDGDTFKIGKSWATVGDNTYLSITTSGNTTFGGTITATNLSGTNTGDQTLSGLGGVPTSRTITINGVAQDLSANRSWSVGNVVGNSNTLSDANASGVTINGGFYTGFNPTNIPASQSSGDWGLLTIPLWTGNSAGERYAIQMAANLDGNDNIFMRKFFFNGAVSRSAWYTLLNSNNYSQYALPLSGGKLSGKLAVNSSANPNAVLDVLYADASTNIIRVSSSTSSGSYRWRIDQSYSMILTNASGQDTASINTNGDILGVNLDISTNSLLNKVKYTQGNYRIYRNLARFDNYNNGAGALAIYTNIPWSAANMLTIQVKGYRYGGDLFDITFGVYAGEGNFYSPCYTSYNANSIFPGYTWYRDANNKVVLVLGNTNGTYGVQMWVAEYKQGFQSLDTTYADGWSIAKITTTTGLSTGTAIPDKSYIGGTFNGASITNSGVTTLQAATRINDGTNGTSPKLVFGNENESQQGFKGMYLESFWMYMQVHYNEGFRIRAVNGTGSSQIIATFAGASGNFTALGDVTAYSDARYKTNIQPVVSALDKVLKLEGVTYNRTDIDTEKNRVGLIAQEVEKVLPEVVNIDENGVYSVAYGNIVGVLVEAIKEQQKQIKELKNLVNALTK